MNYIEIEVFLDLIWPLRNCFRNFQREKKRQIVTAISNALNYTKNAVKGSLI